MRLGKSFITFLLSCGWSLIDSQTIESTGTTTSTTASTTTSSRGDNRNLVLKNNILLSAWDLYLHRNRQSVFFWFWFELWSDLQQNIFRLQWGRNLCFIPNLSWLAMWYQWFVYFTIAVHFLKDFINSWVLSIQELICNFEDNPHDRGCKLKHRSNRLHNSLCSRQGLIRIRRNLVDCEEI